MKISSTVYTLFILENSVNILESFITFKNILEDSGTFYSEPSEIFQNILKPSRISRKL